MDTRNPKLTSFMSIFIQGFFQTKKPSQKKNFHAKFIDKKFEFLKNPQLKIDMKLETFK